MIQGKLHKYQYFLMMAATGLSGIVTYQMLSRQIGSGAWIAAGIRGSVVVYGRRSGEIAAWQTNVYGVSSGVYCAGGAADNAVRGRKELLGIASCHCSGGLYRAEGRASRRTRSDCVLRGHTADICGCALRNGGVCGVGCFEPLDAAAERNALAVGD